MRAEVGDIVYLVRFPRHLGLVSAFLVLFACNLSYALVIRGGEEVYVSEKISDDLLMAGTDGKFEGELVGDIIAAGADLAVDGIIDGNVIACGYMVKIGGEVYRSVRAAGYKLTADGQIRNNLEMAGAMVRVSSTCEVGNDVHIAGGAVDINGVIHGGLTIRGEEVTITGAIGEDVRIWCNKLTIERSAEILGDLVYSSEEKAKIADGAQIYGARKWEKVTKGESNVLETFVMPFVFFIGSFIIGILLFGLCRTSACSVTEVLVSNLPRALGIGLVTFIVVPIALLFALFFVVTIPVSIIGLLTYVVLFYISKLFVAVYVGDRLIKLVSSAEPKSSTLSLFIGLVILTLLFNVPYIGWVIYILTVIVGLGALLIAFNRRRKAVTQPQV